MNLFNWSNPNLYFLIVLSVINAVLMCFLSYKFLQIIQLSDYKLKPYGHWLKDTKVKWVSRIVMLCFLSFCCVFVTNVLFNAFQENKLFGYLGLIFYFSFIIMFIVDMYKIPQKKPLVLTKRMGRLYIVCFILYLAISFGLLTLSLSFSDYLRVSIITLVPIFIPIVVPFACILIYPFEIIVYKIYKVRCSKKLKQFSDLIKIGIGGSYGKTSTKLYLQKFLETKYKVCCTPASYNTPMGITKTVLRRLKKDDKILITEMGAKKPGDIKEICQMVNPNAAIITAVGEQHLETFKNLDTIIKTKSELYESLGENDFCVFNCSNENTKKMYENCSLKNKVSVCIDCGLLYAKNIIATEKGLDFIVVFNDKEYQTHTSILGEHNIQNILCAMALALKLGVSIDELIRVIPTLAPAEHRLELKKLDNNILLIDDSFNSNIQGTAVALKTLGLFKAKRKIVVTPGLVELGARESVENEEFGKRIAKVANLVIIVNKNQSDNIKKGLLEAGFDEKNIMFQESLFEVTSMFKTLLRPGDVILLENDLPDNYK